jgi:diguanylate cyclase
MYKAERLKVFSSNLLFLVSVNIFVATVLVNSVVYDGSNAGKIYWLLSIYAVSCLRLFIHYRVKNDYKHKLDLHFIGVVTAAIVWACYPYMFHEHFTDREQMISLIIFCGMSGGSVTLLSVDLRAALAFTTITVVPYSIMLIITGNSDEVALGFMGLVYNIALCLSAIRSSKFIISSIGSKAKIEKLASNLEVEVQKRTATISDLEHRDILTGLFNRNSFSSMIDLIRVKTSKEPLIETFIHIDIEKFHIINDTYGQEVGDYVLTEIGQKLLQIDKFYGSISARWGSDEFVLYIHSKSQHVAKEFIEHVIEKLGRYIKSQNIQVSPTYHAGYYLCEKNVSVMDAIRNSYLAVSQGKKNNIRICFFDKKIHADNERKEYLRSAMKEALDNDAFYMNYQPIVDIKTGRPNSFEALVRWNLNGELISPAEFISIAEEHGLIIDLGKLVLKMAVQALDLVNQRFPNISISINVSVIQFEDEKFLDYLHFLINQFSVEPRNIHLEITETAMITNLDKLTSVITHAKAIGVMISVDDFGTGFSSISVLKNLRIDYIKIDKSYIDNICIDEKDQSIVSAVTRMTHAINGKVIAEGVEHSEQLDLLARSEIDLYQGYLFSKPVAFDAMLATLDQYYPQNDSSTQ